MVTGGIIMGEKTESFKKRRKAFRNITYTFMVLWMFIIFLIADSYFIRSLIYELEDKQEWNEKRLDLLLEIEEHKVKEEERT